MEELELIRTAHGIDHSLGRLVEATPEAALRERIATVRAEWREITYRIAAQACGIQAAVPVPPRRRGRKPRIGSAAASVGGGAEVDGEANEEA